VEEKRKTLLVGGTIGFIVAGIVAIATAQMVESTSTPSFCGSCHEMTPMVESWKTGPHGPLGNKADAIRASCVDCHLPHENVVSYLVAKGISGLNDFVGHVFHGGYKDNPEHWLEKRKERNHYVFVSSCKHCHEPLPENIMHKKIESGEIDGNCLNCHWYVGHGFNFEEKLKEYLEKKREEHSES
jgi:trimethylamine-N-oxide reductase (cytochrome c) cytochrome c-type subunit TorY